MEVDDNDETTTMSASPSPATTDPSPPRQIHPPRPSPVSPVGGGMEGKSKRKRGDVNKGKQAGGKSRSPD